MSERSYGIGIDLGTSMSAISRVDISSGTYQFFEAQDLSGQREVPSVAFIHLDGTMEFGDMAANRQNSASDAARVVTNVKLLLRRNEPLMLPGLSEAVAPQEIVRGLLAYLKTCFEKTAKMPCTRAVITVPAHEEYDVDYRSAVRDAVMAGEALFESIDIIPEPDAVLLSIGDLSRFEGDRVLVYDMGGGTLDVSIREIEIRDGRPYLRQLAVTGSDAAGRRVTEGLAELMIQRRQEQQGFTYSASEMLEARVINFLEVDDAKRRLSGLQLRGEDRAVQCSLLSPGGRGGQFSVNVRPSEFRSLVAPIEVEARETVEKALSEAGCVASDIDRYFLVGGSSKLLQIEQMMQQLFGGRAPNPLQGDFGTVDPTLSVVRGAAIADLERSEDSSVPMTMPVPVLERRMPYAISMLVDGKAATEVLVPKGKSLPYGPVERTLYLPRTGDSHVDLVLLRGEGDPAGCVNFHPRTVELFEPALAGDELRISWFVEATGELTLIAHDHKDRELVTMRASSIQKETDS